MAQSGRNHLVCALPLGRALLTVAETADQLRISIRGLRRWIASGEVEVVRLGRAVRIRRSEVGRLSATGLDISKVPRESR
jgi:excisionase family DNA binding protein